MKRSTSPGGGESGCCRRSPSDRLSPSCDDVSGVRPVDPCSAAAFEAHRRAHWQSQGQRGNRPDGVVLGARGGLVLKIPPVDRLLTSTHVGIRPHAKITRLEGPMIVRTTLEPLERELLLQVAREFVPEFSARASEGESLRTMPGFGRPHQVRRALPTGAPALSGRIRTRSVDDPRGGGAAEPG